MNPFPSFLTNFCSKFLIDDLMNRIIFLRQMLRMFKSFYIDTWRRRFHRWLMADKITKLRWIVLPCMSWWNFFPYFPKFEFLPLRTNLPLFAFSLGVYTPTTHLNVLCLAAHPPVPSSPAIFSIERPVWTSLAIAIHFYIISPLKSQFISHKQLKLFDFEYRAHLAWHHIWETRNA